MHRVIGLLVAFGLTALIAATMSTAAFPGRNGEIAFQTNRDDNAEIYTMNADGTNRVNRTRNSASDITPHWSADGRRIAFATDRDGNYEIATINADGTGFASVTDTAGENNRWPSWTGDGRILFQRGTRGNRDVYLANADGSGLVVNLTPDSADSAWAAASPRAPMIVFSRYTEADGQRLYTMNTITGVKKLVIPASSSFSDYQANWSPSGNDLVFARFGTTDSDLYVVHKDGTGLRQLTSTPGRSEDQPAFSPDGNKIVFHACVDPGGPSQHCANYVRNVDGSGEVEVTSTPTAPYADTFGGDWIDPFWHTSLAGEGSEVTQTNGRLEEAFAEDAEQGGQYDNIDAHVGTNCKLTGDFDVQADFSLLTWPAANGVQVYLSAFEANGAQVLRESQVWGENYSTWFDPTFTESPTTDVNGSLRLTRTDDAVAGYYRNGQAWAQIASGTTRLDDVTIGLGTSSFMDRFVHQVVNVAWDNFRINSGNISCPTWWADSSPDWQPTSK